MRTALCYSPGAPSREIEICCRYDRSPRIVLIGGPRVRDQARGNCFPCPQYSGFSLAADGTTALIERSTLSRTRSLSLFRTPLASEAAAPGGQKMIVGAICAKTRSPGNSCARTARREAFPSALSTATVASSSGRCIDWCREHGLCLARVDRPAEHRSLPDVAPTVDE